MEQQQQPDSLFGLSVDNAAKSHLYEAAKWARFLAIVGFICCGLMVIGGIYAATVLEEFARTDSRFERYDNPAYVSGLGVGVAIVYIIGAVIWFFPCLFMLRFANRTKTALMTDDQSRLTEGFQQLKVTFRYWGIVTIIMLAFVLLGQLASLGSR